MHLELVIVKIVTIGLGLLIAHQAYRGYRAYSSQPMLYVAIGFALISVGAVIEALGFGLTTAGAMPTSIVAAGMLVILYSLYGETSLNDRSPSQSFDE